MSADFAFVPWLASSGLGALLLALAAVVAERFSGSRGPEVAVGLWWASLVRLVLPPGVGSPVGVSVPIDPVPAVGADGLIALVWLTGAAVMGAMALAGQVRERRRWAARRRTPAHPDTRRSLERCAERLGLRRTPPAYGVDTGAACVGVWSPWIAIPRDLEPPGRSRDLEVVLLHELAHVRRRDGARRLIVLLVQCVFWFHPATWLAARRLSAHAELECDRIAALAATGGADSCRRALLSQVRSRALPRGSIARAFLRPPGVLLSRLRALEDAPRERRLRHIALSFVLALGCIGPAVRVFTIPPVDELDGCLQKRYALYAAMAASSTRDAPASTPDTSTGSSRHDFPLTPSLPE